MAVRNGKKAPGSPVVQQIAQALGETQLAALGQIKGRMRTIGSGNPPVRIIPIVGGTRLTPLELEGFGYTQIMVFTHRSSYRKRSFLVQAGSRQGWCSWRSKTSYPLWETAFG